MSKARLVITAVLVEGRSQSQVARDYGVCQGWVSRLLKRYTLEGDAAFEPRSRRPHTSPTRLPQTTIDLIVELRHTLAGKGLDAGPHTIAWHLEHHHQLEVSVASVSHDLAAAGLVHPSHRDKCVIIGRGRIEPREVHADRPLKPILKPDRRPFREVVHRGRRQDRATRCS